MFTKINQYKLANRTIEKKIDIRAHNELDKRLHRNENREKKTHKQMT